MVGEVLKAGKVCGSVWQYLGEVGGVQNCRGHEEG